MPPDEIRLGPRSSPHAPEMKPEQKAVTPQREIAPQQEQGQDFGLSL
jgi:hypothetical protein